MNGPIVCIAWTFYFDATETRCEILEDMNGRKRKWDEIEEGCAVWIDNAKNWVELERPFGNIYTIENGSAETLKHTQTHSLTHFTSIPYMT